MGGGGAGTGRGSTESEEGGEGMRRWSEEGKRTRGKESRLGEKDERVYG